MNGAQHTGTASTTCRTMCRTIAHIKDTLTDRTRTQTRTQAAAQARARRQASGTGSLSDLAGQSRSHGERLFARVPLVIEDRDSDSRV